MMSKIRRILRNALSILTGLVILASLVTMPTLADDNEIKGHWAEAVLENWLSLGLLSGYQDGSIKPNGSITRAEFIALLNRVENFSNDSGDLSPFVDVNRGAWYYKDIAIALAEGYIQGTAADKMSPDTPITREQAITIVGRIHGFDDNASASILARASDGASVSDWAQIPVAVAMNAGYVTGSSGMINPKNNITRAEAIVLLDRIRTDSRIYAFDGIYGPSSGTLPVKGDVTIAAPGVTLRNVDVDRSLTISSSVGEGEVHISNVIVKGDAYVEGGCKNSLYVADFRVEGSMIVRKYEGENVVRIVISGDCNFSAIVLESGAILVTQQLADGTKINVEVPADYLAGSTFEFIGDFNTITNNGKDADINITGSVNKLLLNESAHVGGTGKIVTAEVAATAGVGTSFETAPISLTGAGKDSVLLPTAVPGSSTTNSGSTTVSVASVAPLTVTAEHNGIYSLPATVTSNLYEGTTKDFVVTWTPSIADTSICGTFVFEGILTMEAGYANPSNLKAIMTLTIVPILTSIDITQLPSKTLYSQGESLDITGLIVTGIYSDESTQVITVTPSDITGFNSYDGAGQEPQELTITINGKTATFAIRIFRIVESGILISVVPLTAMTIANGAMKTVKDFNLLSTVEIAVEDQNEVTVPILADITWDVESAPYNPNSKAEQTFTVNGIVTLPEGIDNPNAVSLEVKVVITVSAAQYTVSFNLNNQAGVNIQTQTITHGDFVTEPVAPTSMSHIFIGWYQNAEGTGDAWDFILDTVEYNVYLFAKWEIKTYIISFDKGNSNDELILPENLTVNHGSTAAKPNDPVLPEYTFAGWYADVNLEIPFVWSTPITSNITLYAKFADALTAAKDTLVFDLIKGANTNEQSIMTNLGLTTSLLGYPGVTITWESNNTTIISNTGIVTRPATSEADVSVILTATLSLSSASITKSFNLIVRKQGVTDVVITDRDERFASGYPLVSFDGDGRATLKIKLKPDIATIANPIIAYFAMDGWSGDWYTFDRESILYGHSININNPAYSAEASGPFDELVINDDNEYSFTSQYSVMESGPVAIGIVLLADDNLDDPLSVATVIKLTTEQAGYVDSSPPSSNDAVFNVSGDKIYAYFNEPIVNNNTNLPQISDFVLTGTTTTVTSVEIGNDPTIFLNWQSWLILTLSSPIDEVTQTSGVNLRYTATSGVNVITDRNTNAATGGIEWWRVTPGKQVVSAYVNPTAGTLAVRFDPGIRILSNYDSLINSGIFSLSYNNTTVGNLKFSDFAVAISRGDVFFTFDKITSGTPTVDDFKVTVTSGFTNNAFEPITIVAKVVDDIMPLITTTEISASLDRNEIAVKFPAGTVINGSSHGCNFILLADGKRVIVRGHNYWGSANQITLQFTNRQIGILANATTVMLSYNPDAAGHVRNLPHCLSDITGAYIPAFGPVAVTKQ